MKLRDAGLSFLGSVLIYVTMAACSGGGAASRSSTTGGGGRSQPIASVGAGGGSGGASVRGGPGLDSGLVDALTDPVPSASADPVSGQRLRARYQLADDGAKQYLPGSWFDAQRNENCAFSQAGDGKQRCLPDGIEVAVFADSACANALVMVPSGCATPTYARRTDAITCDPGAYTTHVFTLGAASTPTTLYLQTSATNCVSAGPALTGFDYYGVGAEIPADTFVAAAINHD